MDVTVDNVSGVVEIDGDHKANFMYAGNVGVMVSPNFDISFKYEGFSVKQYDLSGNSSNKNLGFLGLRLAYTFPLGK